MNVKELTQWLSEFPDQEAIVEIIEHTSGTGYYDQGGNATTVEFNPEYHYEYTDLRGNPFVRETEPWYNKRSLLLGTINQ